MKDSIETVESIGTTPSVYSSIRQSKPMLAGVRYRAIAIVLGD